MATSDPSRHGGTGRLTLVKDREDLDVDAGDVRADTTAWALIANAAEAALTLPDVSPASRQDLLEVRDGARIAASSQGRPAPMTGEDVLQLVAELIDTHLPSIPFDDRRRGCLLVALSLATPRTDRRAGRRSS